MAASMRIYDEERRRRVVVRHHLGRTGGDGVVAVDGVAALHSSDPVTPYLAARARVAGLTVAHLDRLLFEERSLWRMHAMRRTLFVVRSDEVEVFEAGAARDIARKERKRLRDWLAAEMAPTEAEAWLEEVSARVVETISRRGEARTPEIVQDVPELDRTLVVGSGRWTTETPVSSRLLFLLAMEGDLVRTRQAGSWRSSQYAWAPADAWLRRPRGRLDEAEGRTALAARYLATHGPATMTDLRWWTGWTVANTRHALDGLEVTTVELDSGETGYLLAADTDPVDSIYPTVAFLPGLDPTPMGWKDRGWYLGPHGGELFDRNGNVGPTVWLDGRIVGGWAQRADSEVVYELLEEVGQEGETMVEVESRELTEWLDGTVVTPRFRTPLEKELSSEAIK